MKSNKIITQPKLILKREKDIFKLTKCDIIYSYLCYYCFQTKPISHLIEKAENKIYYYIDIETYISSIQEFELLKELFFEENYLNIVRFLSKPLLRIENENLIFSNHIKDKVFNKFQKSEIDNIFYNYKKLLLQTQLSEQNSKLIKFLEKEISFLKENDQT